MTKLTECALHLLVSATFLFILALLPHTACSCVHRDCC